MSELHHLNSDENNPKFEQLNLEIINNIYKKKIQEYFNTFSADPFGWDFPRCTYTSHGNSQNISEHIHSGADYVAIHYVKYNPEIHTPTMFVNKSGHIDYIDDIRPDKPRYVLSDPIHSWLAKFWAFETKEDDFLIHPALLYHFLPPQKNDDDNLRMARVLNISTYDKS